MAPGMELAAAHTAQLPRATASGAAGLCVRLWSLGGQAARRGAMRLHPYSHYPHRPPDVPINSARAEHARLHAYQTQKNTKSLCSGSHRPATVRTDEDIGPSPAARRALAIQWSRPRARVEYGAHSVLRYAGMRGLTGDQTAGAETAEPESGDGT